MALLTLQLLFRRVLLAIPILLCVSALIFCILRLLPADPVAMSLPPGATAEDYIKLKQAFGLDRSLVEQYAIYVGKLLHGDLGGSIFFRRPVIELVATALPATLELVTAGLALGVALGVSGGLLMFALRGGAGEYVLDAATSVMMAIPEFLWAILLILFVGVSLQWLPFIGRLGPGIQLPPHVTGFLLIDSLITGRVVGPRRPRFANI
jgi:ABC-type dipeptide/oligopeptide/nickel transport system permease component